MKSLLAVLLLGSLWTRPAAIGCTLSNPAQDLKYLYPDITSYKEEARDLPRMKEGEALYKKLQARLGSDLDPVYESFDTPYTVYRVFKNETPLGIVHGVNVPGKGGVIQVFLATDVSSGEIRNFFFQRLESAAAKELKKKEFRAQFSGFTLADFYKHDYYAVAEPASAKDKVGRIQDPTAEGDARADFQSTLRGIRKNLILLDIFVYDLKSEPFYEKAREAIEKFKKEKPQ